MIWNRSHTQWDADKGGEDNTQKQSALEMHDSKDTCQYYTDDKQYRRGGCQRLQMIEDGAFCQDTTILKAYHGNEEADAYGNSMFQRRGHHFEDNLSQAAQTEEHKKQAFQKNSSKRKLPRIAE